MRHNPLLHCANSAVEFTLGLFMEQFAITKRNGSLHVEGFPDAVRLIKLEDKKAQRISALLLHRHDLEFADECLDAINSAPAEPPLVRSALWRCAIIHYAKCFGQSAARFPLAFEKIYKGEAPETKLAFDYFKNLRDKHMVHDENAYSQSIPAAVLNGGNKTYKIEKIVSLAIHGETLEQANYANLKLLIQWALKWVASEFDTCCELVTKELEAVPYEKLLKREEVTVRVPTVEEISVNRRKKP